MIALLPALPVLLAAQSGDASRTIMPTMARYAAIFAIFYFILIRPQQKQRKALEDTIQGVKKGDEIVTAGGIVGKVVHIKETMKDGQPVRSAEDLITIESGTSRLVIERGRITRIRGGAGVPTTAA